uniref:Uncharacterized protein n=1 Tax=Musa acuminata subsp. malaccensis TaxID=214687 RepID=A0A804HMR6_MUSAM
MVTFSKYLCSSINNSDPVSENLHEHECGNGNQIAEQNNETFNPSPSPTNVHGFIGMVAGDNSKQPPTSAAPSRALTDFSFQGGKHHGTTATADLPSPNGLHSVGHSNQRDDVYNDNGHPFHRGIRCDGCGMYPIIGP